MTNRSLYFVLRALLATLLICASVLLSSCGGKNSDASTDTSTDKSNTGNTGINRVISDITYKINFALGARNESFGKATKHYT